MKTIEATIHRLAARRLLETADLRELRQAAGVSQADLAARLGVTQQAVSWWERRGRLPTGERLVALVAALLPAATKEAA